MKNILALVALALIAAPAAAQTSPFDAYAEKAWADGKLDNAEKAELARIEATLLPQAAAKAAKVTIKPSMMGPIYAGTVGYIDQKKTPWTPATAALWNSQAQLARATWNLDAMVDYDGDGKNDHAMLMVNGKQTAVIVHRSSNPQPLVVFKSDGIEYGAQIFTAGSRIYLSIPDAPPIVLFQVKGKPSAAYLGD